MRSSSSSEVSLPATDVLAQLLDQLLAIGVRDTQARQVAHTRKVRAYRASDARPCRGTPRRLHGSVLHNPGVGPLTGPGHSAGFGRGSSPE